jgi:hypothetical protein
MAHVQKSPRKLSDLGIKVSRPLETFIQRCLSKDPLTRPQNAGFFLSELQAIANGTAEAGMGTRREKEKEKSGDDEAPQTLVQPGAPTLFTHTFNRDVQTLRARMDSGSTQSTRSSWIQRGLSLALVGLVAFGTWFLLNRDAPRMTTGVKTPLTSESTPVVSDTTEKNTVAPPPEEAVAAPPEEAVVPIPVLSPTPEQEALAPVGDDAASKDTETATEKKKKTPSSTATAPRQGSERKRPGKSPVKNRKKPEVSKIDALLD